MELVGIDAVAVAGDGLHGRTGLALLHGGVVHDEGAVLLADGADAREDLALVVHGDEGRLRIDGVIVLVDLAVAVGVVVVAGGVAGIDEVVQIEVLLLDIGLHLGVIGRIDLVAAGVDAVHGVLGGEAVGVHEVLLHLTHGHLDRPCHIGVLLLHLLGELVGMETLVLGGISEDQLLGERLLVLIIGDGAVIVHLPEDIFLTLTVALTAGHDLLAGLVVDVVGEGIDGLRRLRDGGEDGCLRGGQVPNVLTEIADGGHLDAVGGAAEADVVEVGLDDLGLGVVLLERHGAEDLAHLTRRRRVVIAGDVLDELLGDGRCTTLGVPEVEGEVGHRADGVAVVDTIVGVEALVLGVDEGIQHMLRDLLDLNGDTLDLVAHLIERDELAVLIRAVDVRVIGQLHLLEGDAGGLVHEVEHIDGHGGGNDRAGDDADQEDGQQRR